MDIKFEINLKHLATIAVADALWNEEEIVNKTKIYFCSPATYNKLDNWDLLTEHVINQLNPKSLPEVFYSDIVCAVDSLGKRKRDWFKYCSQRNIFRDLPKEELYENYHKKVYWTYYGTVDEDKTIRSWFDNPNCDLWMVYVMASCLCSEELVLDVWATVQRVYEPDEFKTLNKSYGWHMAAYWDRFFSNDLENFISDIQSDFWNPDFYDQRISIAANMFRLSVFKGYKRAANKFWLELNLNEKSEFYYVNDPKSGNCASFYKQDQINELLLFLLRFEDIQHQLQEKFFNEWMLEILPRMVCWPWVTLIMPCLVYIEGFNWIAHNVCISLVSKLRELTASNIKFTFPVGVSVFSRELKQLWKMLPVIYRENVSRSQISKLFSCWDFGTLKLILNDKDLCKIKHELIMKGGTIFDSFVKEGNEKMIREFIDLIIPINWDENIRHNMKLIYQHILECEFDLVDELLKSLSRSEIEIDGFKNAINSYVICWYFIIKNRLDLADKYLHWRFYSEKLVSAFKLSFSTEKFPVRHILTLWALNEGDVEQARAVSDDFLQWLIKPADLINGLRKYFFKIFNNRKKIKKLIYFFRGKNNFKIIDELKSWSYYYYEEKMYFTLSYEFTYPEMGDLMIQNECEIAQNWLDWHSIDFNEKQTYMEEFLESDEAEFSCKLFISATCLSNIFEPRPSQEMMKNMREFIKFWMKPVVKNKKHKLRGALQKWPEISLEMLKDEQLVREDVDSEDEFDGEGSEYNITRSNYIYCDETNLEIFLDLLKSFEVNYDEFWF